MMLTKKDAGFNRGAAVYYQLEYMLRSTFPLHQNLQQHLFNLSNGQISQSLLKPLDLCIVSSILKQRVFSLVIPLLYD